MVPLIGRTFEHSFSRNFVPFKRFNDKSAQIFKRFFTSEAQSTLIILGNSNIGTRIAREGVKRGHRVIVTSRTEHLEVSSSQKIKFLHTPLQQHLTGTTIKERSYWHDLMYYHVPKNGRLFVVNTIGGSEETPQVSLEDVNVHIPLAAINGINDALQSKKFCGQSHVVHLSTAAAGADLQAPYGKTKKKMEEYLMQLSLSHLTIFRMGYVAEAFIKDEVTQTFKKQHQLSAEELALMPYSFLIGDKIHYNKVMMPIVAIEDVVLATFNAFKLPPHNFIIDAVNQERYTQEQFFSFFSHLLGKTFRPIYMPIDAATKLVKHVDFGHFKSYAVEYCAKEKLKFPSHLNFGLLVGKPLKTLSEMYQLQPGQELVIPRPPWAQFVAHVFKTLWNKPESRRDTFEAINSILGSLISRGFPASIPKPVSQKNYRWTALSEKEFNKHAEENRVRNL